MGIRIDGSDDQTDDGIIEKYCYDDSEVNCDIYGGLYQWNELMKYDVLEASQGICPSGWHIPTDEEFIILEGTVDRLYAVGDNEWYNSGCNSGFDAGGNLKSTGTVQASSGWWYDPNTGATNESGFTALPGGRYHSGFSFKGSFAYFWTSSAKNANQPRRTSQMLFSNLKCIRRNTGHPWDAGYSVRCLKNSE